MSSTGARRDFPPLTPSPAEWRRLEPLIDALLDTVPEHRPRLLAELSAGDMALRTQLECLVIECERSYPLLERTAAESFATVFEEEPPALPASLAGRYDIVREVGRGGMAIVYLARDQKHGRDVAVKVVRPALAAALGRSRFLREIEIAARLRHPHIVPLYDSGEVTPGEGNGADAPMLYYVMPYEPGHSLRERLVREGRLSVEDVMGILHDVCDALAHAHQHGVVHGDIKPENVLLSGKHALITDFGVARAVSEAAAGATLSPIGLAFGTPMYMAPEQAAGNAHVDQRADIYAVGVLGYELLAGSPPFDEHSRRPGSARVSDSVTPLATQRADVPERLVALIMKCMAYRAEDRWQNAGELLAEIGTMAGLVATTVTAPLPRVASRGGVFVLTAASAIVLAIVGAALVRGREERPALLLGRASQLTSEPGLEVQPSLSPDGRHVAYAVGHSLQMHVEVRPVGGGRVVRLTADSSANEWFPRWSPDGSRILFLANGAVRTAPASGGASREEIPSREGAPIRSATWSADGSEIAYVRGDSLLAQALQSGRVRLIATGAELHSCTWSPNGDRLACISGNSFYVTPGSRSGVGPMFGNLAPSRIVLIAASGGDPVSVTDSVSLHQSPVWSRDGNTLYYVSNRQGPRDVYALDVGSSSATTRQPVRVTTGMGAHSVDLSTDGRHLAYAVYGSTANVWAMPIPTKAPGSLASAVPVTSGNQTVEGVRVSPDGRWVIYDSDLSGNSDVYRVPITGGEAERLTHGPLDEFRGALSPDGRELVYHSFATGSRNMFLVPVGGGQAQQLTRSSSHRSMANWAPDGSALTLFDIERAEVFVMRRDRGGRWSAPRFVANGGWRPEWSPDGRTIAFVGPQDGRIGTVTADSGPQGDIYVPGPGDPRAELAIFAPGGRELYFKSHDAQGRASFWSIAATGGRPRLLMRFDDPSRASNRFEFASDGRRFYFTVEDRRSDIWVAEVVAR